MDIFDNTDIYIIARGETAPYCEALYQKLTILGYSAHIYNYDYNNIKNIITDERRNIIIVTETSAHLLALFSHIRKAIWWHSAEGFYIARKAFVAEHIDDPEIDIDALYMPFLDVNAVTHFTVSTRMRRHLLLFSVNEKYIIPLETQLPDTQIPAAFCKK